MEPEKPDSTFVFLAKRLEYAPRYAVDYLFGLLAAIVSDVTITTITLAAIALGLAVGHWLLVVAFFFTLYSLLRIISIVANAIGSSGQVIGSAMRAQQPMMMNQPPQAFPEPTRATEEPIVSGEVVEQNGQRIPVTFPLNNG